jgi:hypothetical protein
MNFNFRSENWSPHQRQRREVQKPGATPQVKVDEKISER